MGVVQPRQSFDRTDPPFKFSVSSTEHSLACGIAITDRLQKQVLPSLNQAFSRLSVFLRAWVCLNQMSYSYTPNVTVACEGLEKLKKHVPGTWYLTPTVSQSCSYPWQAPRLLSRLGPQASYVSTRVLSVTKAWKHSYCIVSMTAYAHARTPVAVSDDVTIKSSRVLMQKLKEVTPQWWQLGLQLKQNPASLDGFKCNPERDTVQWKFQEMLRYWINHGEDDYRTWGALAKAVDESGNRALGKRVRKTKHYREGSRGNSITFLGCLYES